MFASPTSGVLLINIVLPANVLVCNLYVTALVVDGESKKVNIPATEAYGPKNEEAMIKVAKTQLPEGMNPEVGMQLEASQPDGRTQVLVVAEVMETEVVLDANHPLAGKDLIFDIELVEVN